MSDNGDYKVGRGKPPLHTRFKKGDRANPLGRPKGSRNLLTIYKQAAYKLVPLNEGGKPVKKPKAEIIYTRMLNEGVTGSNLKIGADALDRLERAEQVEARTRAASPDNKIDAKSQRAIDAELLRDFRNRLLGEHEPPPPPSDDDHGQEG